VVVYCVWYVLCCCLHGVIKHDDDRPTLNSKLQVLTATEQAKHTTTQKNGVEWKNEGKEALELRRFRTVKTPLATATGLNIKSVQWRLMGGSLHLIDLLVETTG